jgi:hypothetical protein
MGRPRGSITRPIHFWFGEILIGPRFVTASPMICLTKKVNLISEGHIATAAKDFDMIPLNIGNSIDEPCLVCAPQDRCKLFKSESCQFFQPFQKGAAFKTLYKRIRVKRWCIGSREKPRCLKYQK